MTSFSGVSPAIIFGPALNYLDFEASADYATTTYITMLTTLLSTV
jgi:hypothetical protein